MARGEVREAAVVTARNTGEGPQLAAAEQTVRYRHPQHVGMSLQVKPVAQAQRLEFVLRQLTRQPAAHLVAELPHPFLHQ
jgi:hypothetical protein